ncbi:hypothetical protein EKI60_00150 [Candidatus Saccharibacteria bacterium]|nr:MAG: hypothetical protein EKI60_00150 [Candidatus Saccharibacteria bacterium]
MRTELILFITWAGSVVAVLLAFIWVAVRLNRVRSGGGGGNKNELFSEEYRQHMREKGAARFERTLEENAAFLQQDLHAISDQVTEYVKERAGEILKEEFADQKQTVAAAQQHMSESFKKVDQAIAEYRKAMSEQFEKELKLERARRLQRFQDNMADVVTHHVQQTLGTHLSIDDQIKFIIDNLEANKTAIVEDIKREL